MFSLFIKHIEVCVQKNQQRSNIFMKNPLILMYGILKSVPFLQSNSLKCPILIQPQ